MRNKTSIFLAALLVMALIFGGYFYYQYTILKKDPQKIAKDEVRDLLEEVSAYIELPESEEPTVATVVDPEALKNQPFFAKAEKGDKVLIYTNARKAILWSPTKRKIIEVGPIVFNSE